MPDALGPKFELSYCVAELVIIPTVKIIGPYRFHFYSGDRDEKAHIHVERDDYEARFWLKPVRLHANIGFSSIELVKLKN